MSAKEYRILVDGKIVNREYTSKRHKIITKIFEEHGKPFTIEIVDISKMTEKVRLKNELEKATLKLDEAIKNYVMQLNELVKTSPELASEIIAKGNRKIVTQDGKKVEWINLNNMTLFAGFNHSGRTYNIEDVDLFISVPENAKTIY